MSQQFSNLPANPGGARPAGGGGGISGAQTSGVAAFNESQLHSPLPAAQERRTEPVGSSSSSQPVPVPRLIQGQEQTSLTAFMGTDEEEMDLKTPVQEGYGPRLVVLHNIVTGPGGRFVRGDVIWASQLLGHWNAEDPKNNVWKTPQEASNELRRYLKGTSPALREADSREAQHTKVLFVEGEEQLGTALQKTQAQLAAKETEAERLRRLIEAAGIDPNADPETVKAGGGQPGTFEPPVGDTSDTQPTPPNPGLSSTVATTAPPTQRETGQGSVGPQTPPAPTTRTQEAPPTTQTPQAPVASPSNQGATGTEGLEEALGAGDEAKF